MAEISKMQEQFLMTLLPVHKKGKGKPFPVLSYYKK